MTPHHLRYSLDVETIRADETETIPQSIHRLMALTHEHEGGHAVRMSRAKSHGGAVEMLEVYDDLDTMLTENASKAWSEHDSPYVAVGRIRLPRQEAYSPARATYVDDALSFCTSHCLAAHRPLRSIQKARLAAYPERSRARRRTDGTPLTTPCSIKRMSA